MVCAGPERGTSSPMSLMSRLLERFDEALEWAPDPFLAEPEPVQDWSDDVVPLAVEAQLAG